MSDHKPKPESPSPGKPTASASPVGQVRHDKNGRAIWEWAVDTGRHALDSTSRLLKKLEMPGLALEEDIKRKEVEEEKEPVAVAEPKVPTFGGTLELDPLAGARRGFNPYESRVPARKAALPASRTQARTSARAPSTPEKPGLMSRLFGAKR